MFIQPVSAETAPAPVMSPPDPQPLLAVAGVTLEYRTRAHVVTATWRVDFQVAAGERFVLLGPSGCGKSTLLKGVAGFLDPVEGEIVLGGKRIRGPGPDRIMVFQEFDQLLPWKTVRQNVMFPMLTSGKCGRDEAAEHAERFIGLVKLSKFADSYPHHLSGGMKQRVAIARAMAMEPSILLMDEPFAALDALTRRQMQDELLRLSDAVECTIVFVTHSIDEALRIGSRILLLTPHPGRVREEIAVSEGATDEEQRTLADHIHRQLFDERSQRRFREDA